MIKHMLSFQHLKLLQAASPIGHVSAGSPLQLGNGAQGAVLQRSAGTPNSDTQREPQGVTYGAHFRDVSCARKTSCCDVILS